MTLDGLKSLIAQGKSPVLEIHAFEGIIYLVKIVTEVGETMLKKSRWRQSCIQVLLSGRYCVG